MEMLLLLVAGVLKIAFAVALIMGWYPALKVKSKGGGLFLLKSYGVCLIVAVVMLVVGLSPLRLPDFPRDLLFTSDTSLWGELSNLFGQGRRGMSYQVGVSNTSASPFTLIGIFYAVVLLSYFRKNGQLWYRIWGKQSPQIEKN